MTPFKHTYMVLATDFELEPVIEQYFSTYPDAQPRHYDVVCKFQNERHEGDYCYILVWEFVSAKRQRPDLLQFISAYCQVNDKVANISVKSHGFPNIGEDAKYRKK